MRQQEATTTVAVPVATVEQFLADVERWPTFLVGLDSVRKTGHERYVFSVRDGNDWRDAVVVVRRNPTRHTVVWRSLEGPQYSGTIRLTPVDAGRTKVHLALRWHPGTLLAGLAEMLMPRRDRAIHDLQELEGAIAAAA